MCRLPALYKNQIERRAAAQLRKRAGVVPATRSTTPIWRSYISQNRRISTEVHEHNLLKARSPALGRRAHRGGGGALVEGGAPVEAGVVW